MSDNDVLPLNGEQFLSAAGSSDLFPARSSGGCAGTWPEKTAQVRILQASKLYERCGKIFSDSNVTGPRPWGYESKLSGRTRNTQIEG